MKGPLFRPEVVQARRDRSLGGVVFDAPAGTRWLVVAVLALALALAALLVFGRWTPRSPVTGEAAGEPQPLYRWLLAGDGTGAGE